MALSGIPPRRRLYTGLLSALALTTGCSSVLAQTLREDTNSAASAQHRTLDWVKESDVPAELRNRRCDNCGGRYLDPLAEESKAIPPEESEFRARAERSQMRERHITLSGGTIAWQGYRRMRGDEVLVDRIEETVIIKRNVELREPGILLAGDEARIHSKSGEAALSRAQFVLHREHMHGSADLLERDDDGIVHLHDGKVSYCAPGSDDWSVQAEQLDIDVEEGLGTAHEATIRVKDVPIFYIPWLRFPIDDRRRTGFLWPDFGNDSTGGLDITTPVYFNLGPNYDALYSPRFIENRGVNHGLELRYLHPSVGYWRVSGDYMFKDKQYRNDSPTRNNPDRWLASINQTGLFGERWRSRIDYSKASDVDYIKDLDTSNLDSQRRTSLLQLASMDYLGDRWLLNLQAQQFQSLADDISNDYKTLPQFTAQYRNELRPFEVEPVFLAQYSHFDTDDNRVTGQRVYAESGVTYPMVWPYAFATPTVKYRYLGYDLNNHSLGNDSPNVSAAQASLDSGLFFERPTSLFANRNITQTLEPRFYYLYSQHEDQSNLPDFDSAELTFSYSQLFRDTRFSGRDRLDDANQVSVGVTSRFIDDESGESLLSASVGQIFYLRDRKVRLSPNASALDNSKSEMAGELSFTPTDNLDLRTSMLYDLDTGNVNSGHFWTTYRSNEGGLFNIGYSYRRALGNRAASRTTEQVNASFYWPVDNHWSVFAAANYSLAANESVEDMLGVEYDSCCWTMRLLHLRYFNNVSGELTDFSNPNLERESSTQFQIVLKGMGGYGDRITQIMKDMIRGFEERDD